MHISHQELLLNQNYKAFIQKNNLENSEDQTFLNILAKYFQKNENLAQIYLEESILINQNYPNLFPLHEKTMNVFLEKVKIKVNELNFFPEKSGPLKHLILDDNGTPVLDLSEFIVYISDKYELNFEDPYDKENETQQLINITRMVLGFSDQEMDTAKKHDLETRDICQSIDEVLRNNFEIPGLSVKKYLLENNFYKEVNDLIDFNLEDFNPSEEEYKKFKELMIQELLNISFIKENQTSFKAYISF